MFYHINDFRPSRTSCMVRVPVGENVMKSLREIIDNPENIGDAFMKAMIEERANEISIMPEPQFNTMEKLRGFGWSRSNIVDGNVIMTNSKNKSKITIFSDGSYKR